ncbi:hypothetical protein KI130_001266 [Escherichia coli]|nr:hypothetical protein [Escherichia coli]
MIIKTLEMSARKRN